MTNVQAHSNGAEEAWIGAFLLIIPGVAIIGAGVGLLLDKLVPCSVVGLGGGMVLWGIIASFRKS